MQHFVRYNLNKCNHKMYKMLIIRDTILGDLRRESKLGPKSDGTDSGESSRAESAEPPLSTEDILGAVEEAYPNSLTIDDMSRY